MRERSAHHEEFLMPPRSASITKSAHTTRVLTASENADRRLPIWDGGLLPDSTLSHCIGARLYAGCGIIGWVGKESAATAEGALQPSVQIGSRVFQELAKCKQQPETAVLT